MEAQEARKQVLKWIDAHGEEIIGFLQELIWVPSVNPYFLEPGEPYLEGEAQEVVARRLAALGAEIERWEPDPQALAEYKGRAGYYPDHIFK